MTILHTASDLIGRTMGRYRITGLIGLGGMGAVYSADHLLLGRRAAIKVLLPEFGQKSDIVSRFFHEAMVTTAIRHPGVVEVYDYGHADDGSAYIVMEYLEGETLAQRLKRIACVQVSNALFISSQIASALAAAHAKGIVHRDLKPPNIFLIPDRDAPAGVRVKLLDFGIAKSTRVAAGSVETPLDALIGTPEYMSPEQCRGAGYVQKSSDLYALGCILYEMLCGAPPFTGDGAAAVLTKHILDRPSSLRDRIPALEPAIDNLVLRLLAKSPSDRPRSAADLKAELDHYQRFMAYGGEPTGSRPRRSPTLLLYRAAPAHVVQQTTLPATIPRVPSPPLPYRPRRWIPALLGLMVASVGISLALATQASDEPDVMSAVAERATPNAEDAAHTGLRIVIQSRPVGAEIYSLPDLALVGITPHSFMASAGDSPRQLLLRRAGYRDRMVVIPTDESRTYSFELLTTAAVSDPIEEELAPASGNQAGTSP